jgi:hypothetical protein
MSPPCARTVACQTRGSTLTAGGEDCSEGIAGSTGLPLPAVPVAPRGAELVPKRSAVSPHPTASRQQAAITQAIWGRLAICFLRIVMSVDRFISITHDPRHRKHRAAVG